MKKILLVFILVFSANIKTSAQEYSELYTGLDSISKTNVGSNFYRIFRMINYEYNQINDSLIMDERVVVGILKINNNKKFQFVHINEKNKDIEGFLNECLLKAPPFPIENIEKGKDLEYLTIKFDLKKYNYEGIKFDEILTQQKEENKTNRIEELDLYPSYGGKPEEFTDKEKAIESINIIINKVVRKNFKNPEYAMENDIQGRTITNFVINKEGQISTVVVYFSHPILQNQALNITEYLPTFNPGIKDGKPVSVNYQFPLNFRLQ
ncbi:MAG: energy transducer TonB [Weeksellaceae bacterium]|jgi:hypothetical protein|nr:energy transducer TonB [Weeksellaceae bacterium]